MKPPTRTQPQPWLPSQPTPVATMATQNSQPSHAGNHHGYPKLPAVPCRQQPWLPKANNHHQSHPKCTANPLPNRSPTLATTMATQNSRPSHAGNNHSYPKPATTINPKPKMHSKTHKSTKSNNTPHPHSLICGGGGGAKVDDLYPRPKSTTQLREKS